MNLFLSVFFVATAIYAIILAGMIWFDISKLQNKEKQAETETIDVGSITEEQPVHIEEPSATTQMPPTLTERQTEEGVRFYEPAPGYVPPKENTEEPETEPEPEPLTSEELNEKYTQGTEEISPTFEFQCESQELKDYLAGKTHGTQSRISKKTNVLDNV